LAAVVSSRLSGSAAPMSSRRHAHQAAGDEQRVLAALQHPRQPVERRVRIAAAHRLMQRRDQVVVLLAVLVVGRPALLQELAQLRGVQRRVRADRQQGLGQGQQVAAVAVGHGDQGEAGVGVQRQLAALGLLGLGQQGFQRLLVQALEHEDLAARQQSAVQLERGVLGGGADQGDDPLLHERQETVLLGAVEAVDLVDEQQVLWPAMRRPRACSKAFFRSATPENTAEICWNS
jgi:hypothetical protein